ncbi:glutathione S-transferase N-terminal domain-containing protein [Terasakiella sp. A23]|uniref:glutathione S-transferase family protein n=1 Tax=Terasakiella sp. FCG-A23 TaxID=3080561 RepID=UPI00295300C9|nr:glutathione S-transferase N-terminal domain-containing protein [Terasakiella sp. A23]MDV7338042.1 glutathione S-transferase N-terminal domain-containing protein [Terasakiella sp. A23]
MLTFYYHPTPNPNKIALFLEESGLDYELVPVDTMKGEQHTAEFRAINPNGKLPAIDDDGVIVFDSTAILMYLAQKTGKFLVKEEDHPQLLSWLMFIATGLGPYSGQSVHFHHAAPEKIDYARNRYMREAERHYEVLDKHLEGRNFIVGDSYSIADISAWGWIDKNVPVLGQGRLGEFPNLEKWYNAINKRDAVARVRTVGKDINFKTEPDEASRRALFPSNYPK